MKNSFTLLLIFFTSLPFISKAQDFDYYFIGDTSDISTSPDFGICLMGGASEDDNGSQWFLEKADGGNVVVIRASGSDGYNNYFFNDLGVNLQSVETIVFNNANASNSELIQRRLNNAEAIWIAGGDQFIYESYWKGTAIETILNNHVNVKEAPIGGTSAGMAILGSHYFNAANGTVTSTEALDEPLGNKVSIESDFLSIPHLENVITDTHFDNPDRKGRTATFLAKQTSQDNSIYSGIAAEEFVAICINKNGVATVYGEYPDYNDKAFFIRMNCLEEKPEVIETNTPLTWEGSDNDALLVYEIEARSDGSSTFDLTTWSSGSNGEWKKWSIVEGNLTETIGNAPECSLNMIYEKPNTSVIISPNPVHETLNIKTNYNINKLQLIDMYGKVVLENHNSKTLDVTEAEKGSYLVNIIMQDSILTKKIILK